MILGWGSLFYNPLDYLTTTATIGPEKVTRQLSNEIPEQFTKSKTVNKSVNKSMSKYIAKSATKTKVNMLLAKPIKSAVSDFPLENKIIPPKKDKKMSKIHTLVNNTIVRDSDELTAVNKKEREAELLMAELSKKRLTLLTRLDKLNRISTIFDSKLALAPKGTEARKIYTKKFLHEFREEYGRSNSVISTTKNSIEFDINADKMLLRDGRVRVSAIISKTLVNLIDKLRSSDKNIEHVLLISEAGIAKSDIRILKTFLFEQFGLRATVIPKSKNEEKLYPISMKIFVRNKFSAHVNTSKLMGGNYEKQ